MLEVVIAAELGVVIILQAVAIYLSIGTEAPADKKKTQVIKINPEPPIEEDSVIAMTDEHDEDAMDLFRKKDA